MSYLYVWVMWFNSQMVTENGYISGFPAVGGRGPAPESVGKFYHNTFPEYFGWGVNTRTIDGDNGELVQKLRHLKVRVNQRCIHFDVVHIGSTAMLIESGSH